MTEEAKKFLMLAGTKESICKKMDELHREINGADAEGATISEIRDKVVKRTVAIAKEAGFALSPADFEADDGEMDDAEMQAVSGGWYKCVCVAGGGGTADKDGGTCACIVAGVGMRKDNNNARCGCPMIGYGYDANIPPCDLMG
ncbi:MAG: hypothetical protein VB082_03100 [Christensenella sp.]|nr:hypothetical protein [Christensenella sp.]